jgi:hypothetical protein
MLVAVRIMKRREGISTDLVIFIPTYLFITKYPGTPFALLALIR